MKKNISHKLATCSLQPAAYKFKITNLKFDKNGLIPAIIQDYKSGEVLMFAYTNKEALEKTFKTGKMHFWSRSRKKLWLKGETSGHFQIVKAILFDCDQDALLVKIRQFGAACHTNYRSCFYRKIAKDGNINVVSKK